ncbi:MAG TPA: galactosyldiacylglycerol synthase [Chloroflexi bacterium]|nr:galactosyldiacylglycerol synthase [Chloroflexota bacterium]HHW86513.1 galactosyldiacylglycerol synthase [Chloroflexota bacterium]
MLYRIYNSESGELLGEITEGELSSLTSFLEEESAEDRDYYITTDTIDYLETNGADAALIALLRKAIGAEEGVEIRWGRA